jgi:hypothetical protein
MNDRMQALLLKMGFLFPLILVGFFLVVVVVVLRALCLLGKHSHLPPTPSPFCFSLFFSLSFISSFLPRTGVGP